MVRTAYRTTGTSRRTKKPVDVIPEEVPSKAENTPQIEETPKMKFRLLHGTHSQVIGLGKDNKAIRKEYSTGDVIESDVDLTESFPNRFVRLTPEMEIQEKVAELKRRNPSPKIKAVVDKIADNAKAVNRASPRLRVVVRGPDMYDVIREDTGLPINDKFLSLDEAKSMERAGNESAAAADTD